MWLDSLMNLQNEESLALTLHARKKKGKQYASTADVENKDEHLPQRKTRNLIFIEYGFIDFCKDQEGVDNSLQPSTVSSFIKR